MMKKYRSLDLTRAATRYCHCHDSKGAGKTISHHFSTCYKLQAPNSGNAGQATTESLGRGALAAKYPKSCPKQKLRLWSRVTVHKPIHYSSYILGGIILVPEKDSP
jgi:hypothetical protein